MSIPKETKPQFVMRPMVLFDDLSAHRAHSFIWLLCEYVTRWTVNWYNNPEVLLSADEFMHGRRKPNSKDRYDGGIPIDSRTSVLHYLKVAVEEGYLQERETWDSLGRKAYSLPPWYHPDTCTQYEQVMPTQEPPSPEKQKPVHQMDTSSPPPGQDVQRVYRGSPAGEQENPPQNSLEAAQANPIETPIQTFHTDQIETLQSLMKNQEEKTKGDEAPMPEDDSRKRQESIPPPSSQQELPKTADDPPLTPEEEAARAAELTKQAAEQAKVQEEARQRHEERLAQRAQIETRWREQDTLYARLVEEELRLWGLVKRAQPASPERAEMQQQLDQYRASMAAAREQLEQTKHAYQALLD